MKYGSLDLDRIEEFMDRIGGMEGLSLVLSDQVVTRMLGKPDFPVVHTITPERVPSGTVEDLAESVSQGSGTKPYLVQRMISSNGMFRRLFERHVEEYRDGFEVCVASAGKIVGKTRGITNAEVYAHLKLMGALCPIWLAAVLVTDKNFISERSKIRVASEPLQHGMNQLGGFLLRTLSEESRAFFSYGFNGPSTCHPNTAWMFIWPPSL